MQTGECFAYFPLPFLTISQLMSPWREDLLTSTLEEILGWQDENRAWSKDLRRKVNALVNSRLANEISLSDYLANRKLAHEDAAECRRRAAILDAQMVHRAVGALPRGGVKGAARGNVSRLDCAPGRRLPYLKHLDPRASSYPKALGVPLPSR